MLVLKGSVFMLNKILKLMLGHIAGNLGLYVLFAAVLVLGILLGSVSGAGFDDNAYFENFFGGLNEFSSSSFLKDVFLQAVFYALIIFVFGLSPFGCIVIPAVIGYKGFAVGYTVSASFAVFGFKSLLFIILGMLPSAVFWIPVFLFSGVSSILYSIVMLRFLRKKSVNSSLYNMSSLIFSAAVLFAGVFISKIIEIYIIPQMLNLVGGIYV